MGTAGEWDPAEGMQASESPSAVFKATDLTCLLVYEKVRHVSQGWQQWSNLMAGARSLPVCRALPSWRGADSGVGWVDIVP